MNDDSKLYSLNTAISEALPHMRRAAAENPHSQVLIRVLAFSDDARWTVSEPTPIEDFQWHELSAGGSSNLGLALSSLAEELDLSRMPNRALPPVLVLVSDGHPTDDWEQGLDDLLSQFWGQNAIRIAIAIGRDADQYALRRFSSEARPGPIYAHNVDELANYIDWLSTAAVTLASSPRVGDQGEQVSFTAAYPSVVSPTIWYSLLMIAHLSQLESVVENRIVDWSRQLGTQTAVSRTNALTTIPRGTVLRVKPHAEGLRFNPSEQETIWLEDIHELRFRLQVSSDRIGQTALGAVEVYVGSLAIAQVPLAIHVRDAYDQHHSEHTTATAQLFQTIFASYAHEDSEVVKACAEVYRALGITMLIDRDSLRSGERWYPELRRFVQEADLFQLFWSSASSNSTYVAEEWRQALSLLGLKGERFIRPLYWEDPLPPPPNELSQFHFAFLDRKALAQIPQSRSPRPRSPLPLATLDPDDLDPDDLVW